ncbi:MAG: Gfo/Idh/MocA family oxidoreductase [Actinobacteria bacterium]|nr:Gfo/Idh/MocA family oxidoreductase [Actinomycetota bacterium]
MNSMGVAIVGAGMRCISFLDYLKAHPSQGFVTGIYDTIPARVEYLLKQYDLPDAVTYESLEQAVSDERVGAVLVCTPDSEHVTPVVASLKAGKHVYCEKPLAITLSDCDEIISAAKKTDRVFYLGMNLRHGPVHETLHEMLKSGQFGRLLTIETNEYYYGGRTYFRRWNRLRKYGGGLWITKTCHDFDLINWFAGGNLKRVFAVSSLSHYAPIPGSATHCRICSLKRTCPDYYDLESPTDPQLDALATLTEKATGQPRDLCLYTSDKDTFDNGMALVEYDNDVRATHTLTVVSARDTRQMRLTGTEGSAEGDMEQGTVTMWRRHSKEKIVHDVRERICGDHGGADSNIIAHFFHCCRTGEQPRSSWSDGRLSVQLGLAARESCDTGNPVEIVPG